MPGPILVKKAARVIEFQNARVAADNQPDPPQPPSSAALKGTHLFKRRSIIAMFLLGRTTRRVAAFHGVTEAQVDEIKRSEMWLSGVATRNGIRATDMRPWHERKAA